MVSNKANSHLSYIITLLGISHKSMYIAADSIYDISCWHPTLPSQALDQARLTIKSLIGILSLRNTIGESVKQITRRKSHTPRTIRYSLKSSEHQVAHRRDELHHTVLMDNVRRIVTSISIIHHP